MAIEQCGFFNVPHPLQHGPTVHKYVTLYHVYNGHLRGLMTHTPIAFGSGAVTTCFYDLGLVQPVSKTKIGIM